jgi:predicted transcriptional regulator
MSVELVPKERVVLDIVQDYLSKNRQFDIDDIIPYISYYLRRTSNKLNYEGIRAVLYSLVKKKFLIEGSKLTHDDVLNNEKRKKIYNHIFKNPGIYFTRLVKDLGYTNHVVVWHLNILIKFNFIKKRILDRHEIFFDSSVEPDDAKLNFFTSLEKAKMIINYLRNKNFGITKTKLAKELKMHLNTTSKYLGILQKFKLIIEEKIDNQILYFLEEEFLTQLN